MLADLICVGAFRGKRQIIFTGAIADQRLHLLVAAVKKLPPEIGFKRKAEGFLINVCMLGLPESGR